jgi:uncharacterized protein (DUF1800 family)
MLTALNQAAWNPVTAAHLLNRAGFGSDPGGIARAAARSPSDLVEEILDFSGALTLGPPTWLSEAGVADRPYRPALRTLPEAERQKIQMEMRRREGERMAELRAWWLYRMRYSRCPLQEKLTLFWHGHFATSMEKVRSTYCMYQQNQTFRTHAAGNVRDLVVAVAQDPAMLIYLDNAQSRAGHPNENFARELMELFTLGEGNYSEDDIQQAARAFTGWTLEGETFAFASRPRMHDDGIKTLFGKTGRLDGRAAIDLVLDQPAAASWITRKLWTFFAYADPNPTLVKALAERLLHHRYELRPWLREVFLSQEFYGARALHTQVKSPVHWLINAARSLEAPLPSGEVCSLMLRGLGQELFAPPNVKGWDGGTTWINANTLFQRYNFAGQLVKGGTPSPRSTGEMMARENLPPPEQRARLAAGKAAAVVDPDVILPRSERTSRAAVQQALEWRLFQRPLRDRDHAVIAEAMADRPEPSAWTDQDVRTLLHLMMSTPMYQLT